MGSGMYFRIPEGGLGGLESSSVISTCGPPLPLPYMVLDGLVAVRQGSWSPKVSNRRLGAVRLTRTSLVQALPPPSSPPARGTASVAIFAPSKIHLTAAEYNTKFLFNFRPADNMQQTASESNRPVESWLLSASSEHRGTLFYRLRLSQPRSVAFQSMIPKPAVSCHPRRRIGIDQTLAHSAGKGNAAILASIAPNTPFGGLPLRSADGSRPCS
jgi:hypothetical protein